MKKVQGTLQPNGTVPYEVQKFDTMVSIAAQCDVSVTLLKKLNRMMTETIFPGQVLFIPGPGFTPLNSITRNSLTEKIPSDPKSSEPIGTRARPSSLDNQTLQLSTSPVKSIPGHAERQAMAAENSRTLPRALSEDEVKKIDEECHERFVKMNAKYIDPSDEEVPGILLVTPDAVMFDADDHHPLVLQNGREAYQLVASISSILLVMVYHGASTLTIGRNTSDETTAKSASPDTGERISSDLTKDSDQVKADVSNDVNLPKTSDILNRAESDIPVTGSVLANQSETLAAEDRVNSKESGVNKETVEEISTSGPVMEKDTVKDELSIVEDSVMCKKPGTNKELDKKDGENVPASGHMIKEAGCQIEELIMHPCSGNTVEEKTVDASQQSDIISAKNFELKKSKTSATSQDAPRRKAGSMLVDQNLSDQDSVVNGNRKIKGSLEMRGTTQLVEVSNGLSKIETGSSPEKGSNVMPCQPETPLTVFLRLKVDRSLEATKGFFGESPPTSIGRAPVKLEYWYSIPCNKVDQLYAFFVQWTTEDGTKGFFATKTDSTVDYKTYTTADGQKLVCEINKDWELVNTLEYQRMKSQEEIKKLPLPDLSESSSIMETSHIAVLICHLPPIAEGSPWNLVYSTSKHGFSLNTLYRRMMNVDSPIFLIIQDVHDQVFGAMVSCALKMSDHFYGSGESYLFTFYPEFKKFGWTGFNSFFIKGNKDSLAIGAGEGSNGLWLDGNLYHGRTQRCQTYENELLTISQDFTIKCLETWCFD